ncbi:MAG: GSCFA domain-containing protein [Muribaculaceae bacterium]|nr:GSCFA domain-containing protein [Muribaculaceae bacterium]
MKFRTEYTPRRASFTLSPENPVVLLGSCFAANMAEEMKKGLWDANNPLGTLYNPESIALALETFLSDDTTPETHTRHLVQDDKGLWHSFMLDSSVSSKNRAECLEKVLKAGIELHRKLSEARALFVTFGTSIYYRHIESGLTVSNCHKLPATCFYRRRLTVCEIKKRWVSLCRMLHEKYPELEIVFTVSPVRHLKDGFAGNARSKAVLLLAVEEICETLPYCSYFPAYEILNDDLRDYRFYASDLVHPSQEGIEYIYDIFKQTYLEPAGLALLKEGEKLLKQYNHRPLIATPEEAEYYLKEAEHRIREFLKKHPGMNHASPAHKK